MSDSAIVIIATIGKPTLARAIESLYEQTYERGPGSLQCLVVVDGPEFDKTARAVYHDAIKKRDADWIDIVTLPQNTGSNGYVCHRIYGATPMIVNQDYIFYLDDDNWFDPDHVKNCIKACEENSLDWCFAMRNIYQDGEYLCRDECESVGIWPVWYNPDFSHIDTNCYCFKRSVSVHIAPHWHKSRYDKNKNVQPSADTQICNILKRKFPNYAMVPRWTVNYELGSWELSPKPEFFIDGNLKFAEQHGGRLPWEPVY